MSTTGALKRILPTNGSGASRACSHDRLRFGRDPASVHGCAQRYDPKARQVHEDELDESTCGDAAAYHQARGTYPDLGQTA